MIYQSFHKESSPAISIWCANIYMKNRSKGEIIVYWIEVLKAHLYPPYLLMSCLKGELNELLFAVTTNPERGSLF